MTLRLPARLADLARGFLLAAVLASPLADAGAQALRAAGTGSAIGTMRLLGEALTRQDKSFELSLISNLGSSGGVRALQAGAVDIALVSRPLKPEEAATGLVAFEYGRSPFVFVTSKPTAKSITLAGAADFLSGRATSWADGAPVRPILRPKYDVDTALLTSFSADMAQAIKIAHERPGLVVVTTDQEAADEAERLPGSFSANTLALLISERRKLHVLALGGVAPSARALADGSYPYYKALLIVTRGAPTGAALRFIEFVKSPQGRAILEANGHVVPRG